MNDLTATAVIDNDSYTVTRSVLVDAPRERVWQALTDPRQLEQWWTEGDDRADVTDKAGTWNHGEHGNFGFTVDELDPMDAVAYSWSAGAAAPLATASTRFRFVLEDVDGGVQVTVVETGFEVCVDPAAQMESHREGWNTMLDRLAEFATKAV
jgi:uncharacterized protein YndB with AHSA1/START domain